MIVPVGAAEHAGSNIGTCDPEHLATCRVITTDAIPVRAHELAAYTDMSFHNNTGLDEFDGR